MSAVPRTKVNKPFLELTDAEKVQATQEFDQEFIIDSFRELTPRERADWEKIQSRLKLTDPAPTYQLVKSRLPVSLIKKIDSMAKKRKISRSRLILLALGLFVAREREKSHE